MIQAFLTFIEKNKLFEKTDRLLLAVSGGVDSMVLLDLVQKTGYSFGVAHVNYQLRGEDSNNDEALVRHACEQLGVDFYLKKVDPAVYKTNESIQMAARRVRYDFFDELSGEHGFTRILTAHNANDNLETVLFNFTKGTGIAGLTGIASRRGKRVRPLLFAHKEHIYDYAESQKLPWREDRSNQKDQYHRNLIRNKVVPLLKQINPSLIETFKDTVARIQGADQLVRVQKEKIAGSWMTKSEEREVIDVTWVKNDKASLLVLSELLKSYGFTFRQVSGLFEAIGNQRVGATFYAGGFQVSLDRDRIFVEEHKEQNHVEVTVSQNENEILAGPYKVCLERVGHHKITINADVACLDADKVIFPLTIRNWRQGDLFQPLGMSGKKKVSDFMIDSKIPVTLKKGVLILESDGQVVWVMGYRIDDRFKVSSTTKTMLKITLCHA